MDSVFEVQRQTHEEIERYERALYTLLSRPQLAHELRIRNDHKASQILDRVTSRASTLKSIYDDGSARSSESNVYASSSGQANDLSEFYNRLVKLQEHHSKYPDAAPGGFELELEMLLEQGNQDGLEGEAESEDPVSLMFTGEETLGKYLDLYDNHLAYTNIRNVGKRPGYLQYLDLLANAEHGTIHMDLPRDVRTSKDYEQYIKALQGYLLSFMKRTQPLVDVDTLQDSAVREFAQQWEDGEKQKWMEPIKAKELSNGQDESSGIWCAACQKSYSKQTVYDAHLTSKKHVKATQKQEATGTGPPDPNGTSALKATEAHNPSIQNRIRSCALNTYLSNEILRSLLSSLVDTKSNVERRFSLTAREREQELLDQAKAAPPPPTNAQGDAVEEDEEEERIYNPLKLPMGWDGKPIPYWLYKLHGLGVEYRCEICSDHVYMGRKNFDRHFQEARHAFGMRALGLPNTKHFHEITKIADALTLAEKLKKEGRHEIFENETMEELEDDEGNVYNRKTYDDLKKQGII